MKLEFFFDCSSPWTYLAFHNVQPMAEELGLEIDWQPILVGGIFNTVNQSVYEQRAKPNKAKARYHKRDMMEWAEVAGLKIKFPPAIFPINSVKAMRACIALKPQGLLVPFATRIFEAYWSEDQDIASDEVMRDCLTAVGADADAVMAAIQTPEIKDQLKANTQSVIDRGGFGSPTMFLGERMYFGNDRLQLIEAQVKRLNAQ